MLRKILAPLFLIALAGCNSDSGTATIIQTDQAQLVDAIPGPSVTAKIVSLPGRIEAEDFISQNGIRLGDTNDSGNSQFVGHIENNDYVEYDIDAPANGTYDLSARVASLKNNATVNVIANGQNAGSFNVSPTGGWEAWETVSATVNLSEGRQTLRLQFTGNANGLMNINWFSLAPVDEDTSASPPPPSTGTDIEIGSDRWTVSTNNNSDDAFLAIDGNDNTRWTTRQAQRSGQQFTIDLNSTRIFDRLVLDSSGSIGDYPRDYEVEVSENGSQWSTVAAGTGTTNGLTVIDFADQDASHIRVTQLGSASRNWWSIHELSLFANSSDRPIAPPAPEETDTPIDGEILSHDFNDGTMGPFVACTVKNPNYTRAENGRVKTYWTEAGFDGTRTSRGSEFCDAIRDENELKTRDEGSMGFTVNVDTGHSRTSHSALAQVFGFNLARDQFSWSGLLELQDGDLVVEHRNCLCNPTSFTIVEDFEYGRDHDIIIEFKVSNQRRGKFKVWIDGELMYNATGINFGFGDFNSSDVQINQSFTTFKLGMYNHSDGDYTNNEERIVYYDDVTWYNGKNGFDVVNPR